MKGIEAIVAHIDADSRQECSALRQSAQRRAEELRERERQKQARFAAREHERMEEHLSQIEQSRRQLLVMERRSALLRTRQAVVEEAFAAARASLEGLDTARREKLYLKLAEAAVEPKKEGEALVCREDRGTFGAALQRTYPRLHLSAESCGTAGFILRYGAVEVDCTLPTLLAQVRRRESARIATLLFGAEDDDGT